MEYSRSSVLKLSPYLCHGKGVEDLGQSYLCTTMELESLKQQAQEEIRMRDEQLSHLKELLYQTIKERDEARQKCQTLQVERILLQQQQQTLHKKQIVQIRELTVVNPLSGSGLSSIEDEPIIAKDDSNKNTSNNNFSSSDCDESIVSSPVAIDPAAAFTTPAQVPIIPQQIHFKRSSMLQSFDEEDVMELLLTDSNRRPLPEKGKLLQAVMEAGPLLQSLLLAGPLPQWRHPPPPLEFFEIPPLTIYFNCNNRISRKRGLPGDCSADTSAESYKLQKQAIL